MRSRILTLTMILAICFMSFVNEANARIYVQIDEVADKKFPIAILPAVNTGEGRDRNDWAEELPQAITKDLDLTGIFEFVQREMFPVGINLNLTKPENMNFTPWTILGVQTLITSSFSYEPEEKVSVTLRLLDPFLGSQIIGKSYEANPRDITSVAHHFADEVMQALTGERGIFSTKIAFVSDRSRRKDLYMMDIDGGNLKQLTNQKTIILSPAWSPDGRAIAYSAYAGKNPEIHIYNVEKKSVKKITSNGSINLSPVWTRGGEVLTVSNALEGNTEIFNIDLSGSSLKRLTNSFGIDINASWSPDGKQFVFASERGGKLHLFRADENGRNIERLTWTGYHNDSPAWSPKGDKIVFQSRDEGRFDIFIMNPDGSMIQRLTSGSGDNESPSWAPNGRYITFSSTRTGKKKIYIMKSDGDNQRMIDAPGNCAHPDWSPYFK